MTTADDVRELLSEAEDFIRAADHFGALSRAQQAARALEHVLEPPGELRDEVALALERFEAAYRAEVEEVRRRQERHLANERRSAGIAA